MGSSKEIVLAAAVRTPIGRFGGGLANLKAADLGVAAAQAALARAGLRPDQVDQAIFGHARQAGNGPNVARQVSVRAGLPVEKPAYTINQACASGLQAVISAARAIRLGEAEVVLAGGTESMSTVPYLLTQARNGYRMGHGEIVDGMYRDGFQDPLCGQLMGETAETLADRYDIGRDEQDAYALETQQRCGRAIAAGLFQAELAPLQAPDAKGKPQAVAADEHPRPDTTLEAMAKLKPVFRADGTVHAGNSSGITDGAAAMLVLSTATAAQLGVTPMARIVGYEVCGVAPEIMGIGPVPAVRKLLERTGVALADIDLVELNEAFAAQVLACDRELRFDRARLNVNGGAIALGHPIGCSGARILVTLLHELARRQGRLGMATLCVSGGMGLALLVERI